MPNAMHSLDSNSSVPAFLIKLWKLVEDPTCDYLIAWSESGLSFMIKDQANFAKDLLPLYFKHSNMASFIRQLNMYGFKKVLNIEKSGLKNDNNEVEFHHGCFRKGRSELLELIKRKISNPKIMTETPVVKTNAKDILVDLTSIREKQENMDNMLLKMKSENELLWRELTTMRQKHKAQEQIIQKVIQFLVSIVQRNNPNIGVQRKINRMLHNSPSSKGNSSQVSRTIDVLRKKNPDCIIVPEQIVSPLGPVIHEVLDGNDDENPGSSASQNLNAASPCVKSPESVTESNEDTNPKYRLVSLLNNSNEPLGIFEALTPTTPSETENNENESILGIPLEYINMQEDAGVANVLSIPETNNAISLADDNSMDNVISIPEGCSIHDIISAPEENSMSEQSEDTTKNVSKDISEDSADKTSTEFLTDIVSFSDLQPSTSQDLIAYSGDFNDDFLSESLHTPKIPTSDEDFYTSLKRDNKKSKSPKKNEVCSSSVNNEHNYQLATTEPSNLAKNVLSNHLLSVDEKLNFTQDRLASSPWNFDVQKLLGVCASPYSWNLDPQLFSSDELVNYDAFTNQLADEINIKTEPSDVIGNELVQFSSPNMLEMGMDIGNSPLFEALQGNVSSNEDLDYQPTSLLDEVLNETAASQAAANFLSEETELNISPRKRHKPAEKNAKGKRRKIQ